MHSQEKNVKKNNKFVNLNFNLKNEIFNFIPIEQVFTEMLCVNKKFNLIFRRKKLFNIILSLFQDLIKEINFSVKNIKIIKSKFSSRMEIDEERLNEICNFFLKLKFQKYSQLDLTDLKNLHIKYLTEFLAKNLTLNYLFLFENKVGKHEGEIKALCEALVENKTLKYLYISINKICKHASDAASIKHLLSNNNDLELIDLSYNKIGQNTDDVKIISEGLKENKALKNLNFSANKIGLNSEYDFKFLCEALMQNNHIKLEYLDLSFNKIANTHDNAELLISLIKNKNSLKLINIIQTPLRNNEYLITYIRDHKFLKLQF